MPDGAVDLRDDRRVGRFFDAGARFSPVDRDRRGARFPDRVARRPERYAIPNGKSVADVKAELQSVLASELAARKFSYTRSDGSAWTLSLKDVIDRAADLEMAYNPERLRRAALGRAGEERRGVDVQAACAGGAAREDDGVPHVVPRAALADARLAVGACCGGRRRSFGGVSGTDYAGI